MEISMCFSSFTTHTHLYLSLFLVTTSSIQVWPGRNVCRCCRGAILYKQHTKHISHNLQAGIFAQRYNASFFGVRQTPATYWGDKQFSSSATNGVERRDDEKSTMTLLELFVSAYSPPRPRDHTHQQQWEWGREVKVRIHTATKRHIDTHTHIYISSFH